MLTIQVMVGGELKEQGQVDAPVGCAKSLAYTIHATVRKKYPVKQVCIRIDDAQGNTLYVLEEGSLGAVVHHTGHLAIKQITGIFMTVISAALLLVVIRACNR